MLRLLAVPQPIVRVLVFRRRRRQTLSGKTGEARNRAPKAMKKSDKTKERAIAGPLLLH
jgi:hypothetical protein